MILGVVFRIKHLVFLLDTDDVKIIFKEYFFKTI